MNPLDKITMCLPNVIIAGAPRCGTSSVFFWLADHPEVCGSSVKETFYLMDIGYPLLNQRFNYHEHGLDGYQGFFRQCNTKFKVILEATAHYIYQETALDVLSSLNPAPQIIFILRRPSERIYSSYKYTKNNHSNLDKKVSFRRFVNTIKSNSINSFESLLSDFATDSAYTLRHEIKYSRYIDYIQKWVSRFGKEQIQVLLFENMKSDPGSFMAHLSESIGIDPEFYDNYDFTKIVNESLYIKNQFLHKQISKVAGLIPGGIYKSLMKKVYLKIQSGREELTLEDKTTLSELDTEFRPFNQRLSEEMGVDITAWD